MTQLRERIVESDIQGWVLTRLPTIYPALPHFTYTKLVGRGRLTMKSVEEGYSMWQLEYAPKCLTPELVEVKVFKRVRIMSAKEALEASKELMQWYLKGCPDESNTD